MQLVRGLTLQVVGCLFSAIGLAFMKLSSEIDGARPMILRWRWWLGFMFLAVLATAIEGVVLTLVPLTIVAPFAGLTILFSMLLANAGCISARVPLRGLRAAAPAARPAKESMLEQKRRAEKVKSVWHAECGSRKFAP